MRAGRPCGQPPRAAALWSACDLRARLLAQRRALRRPASASDQAPEEPFQGDTGAAVGPWSPSAPRRRSAGADGATELIVNLVRGYGAGGAARSRCTCGGRHALRSLCVLLGMLACVRGSGRQPCSLSEPRRGRACLAVADPAHTPQLPPRGEGWGEEFFPRVSVERRTIKRKTRSREPWQASAGGAGAGRFEWLSCFARPPGGRAVSRLPSTAHPLHPQDGSIEAMLLQEGVPEESVEAAVARVTAWRITRGGRALVDKRRRRRVELNLPEVVSYLERTCRVPRGARGVGSLLQRFPLALLCKPSATDRFDRRALELAAFAFQHGSADVPDAPPHCALHAFVMRCRCGAGGRRGGRRRAVCRQRWSLRSLALRCARCARGRHEAATRLRAVLGSGVLRAHQTPLHTPKQATEVPGRAARGARAHPGGRCAGVGGARARDA